MADKPSYWSFLVKIESILSHIIDGQSWCFKQVVMYPKFQTLFKPAAAHRYIRYSISACLVYRHVLPSVSERDLHFIRVNNDVSSLVVVLYPLYGWFTLPKN